MEYQKNLIPQPFFLNWMGYFNEKLNQFKTRKILISSRD